jgi:opacity protein-like surface antigen
MVKLSGVLFFISFVFIYSSSAQIIEKNNPPTEAKKPEIYSFAESRREINLGKNPFASPAEKNTKPFENRAFGDLPVKEPSKKAEQDADQPSTYKLPRGVKEWNFEFGYSPFEPTHFAGEKEYNTAGRKLGVAVFRWGRVIGTSKGVTWQYLFEAVPFIISLKNEVTNPAYISETATPGVSPTRRETSYGVGLTPAAFRFYFLPNRRLKPYAQLGTGFIYMNKPQPLPNTTRFNFSGYFGGGLMYQLKPNRAVTLSYRYFHLSNANVTYNPGYNANVFALGYSFFYGK